MRVDPIDQRHLALDAIDRGTFYKIDEITTDLICCDIDVGDVRYTLHEEMSDWSALIRQLEGLCGFDCEWFAKVSQPPFATTMTIAFDRPHRN